MDTFVFTFLILSLPIPILPILNILYYEQRKSHYLNHLQYYRHRFYSIRSKKGNINNVTITLFMCQSYILSIYLSIFLTWILLYYYLFSFLWRDGNPLRWSASGWREEGC